VTRQTPHRRIGTLGAVVRVVVGLGLVALAFLDRPAGLVGGLQAHDLVLGLGVFPGVMILVALVGSRLTEGPVRFLGPVGLAVNTVVIVALFTAPYTAGAAALFYGTSLLVAAWRALPGCEATVISNLLLRRDDQIGCPTMSPVDALEARLHRAR
jgi:hypothetical protein